jgi:siroheme synthase-like protein
LGYYPIFLDLRARPCVVIGGGDEAERKTHELLDAGAEVTVISADHSAVYEQLSLDRRIRLERRDYRQGDLAGAFLALSATTSNRELSERVAAEAEEQRVLLNVVDVTDLCTWIYPAVVRRGDATIAISTNGRSPAMARFLKRRVEEAVPEEFAVLLDILADIRQELREERLRPSPGSWQDALDGETLTLAAGHDWDAVRNRIKLSLATSSAVRNQDIDE